MKNTIKQQTIDAIKKVLKTNRKYYISSDFPFVQTVLYYITYRGKVMNEYLRDRGYLLMNAKDVNIASIDGKKVRGNRNIYIKTENFIRYKK